MVKIQNALGIAAQVRLIEPPQPHTRQDKRGAPLITQGLGRHRLALLLAFLLVIAHGDRLGRQLL